MTPIAKTWNARLDTGTLTKGQINQVINCIYPMSAGYTPFGKRTNLTGDEVCDNCGSPLVVVRSREGRFCTSECAEAFELS